MREPQIFLIPFLIPSLFYGTCKPQYSQPKQALLVLRGCGNKPSSFLRGNHQQLVSELPSPNRFYGTSQAKRTRPPPPPPPPDPLGCRALAPGGLAYLEDGGAGARLAAAKAVLEQLLGPSIEKPRRSLRGSRAAQGSSKAQGGAKHGLNTSLTRNPY